MAISLYVRYCTYIGYNMEDSLIFELDQKLDSFRKILGLLLIKEFSNLMLSSVYVLVLEITKYIGYTVYCIISLNQL